MPLSEIILISMGLLAIATIAAGLFRNFSIPYTVLLVVIGIAIAELERFWPSLQALETFVLTPELVFFIFLPALIFESGLSLDARQLMKDLAPVLTMAVPALLISTTLVGGALWLLIGIDLTTALLFGALISATDPVAVIALFKELGAPLRLNVLVEGESLFNDATAIVVFSILLAMILEGTEVSVMSTGAAILQFFVVFVGGALVGALIGLLVSEMLYQLKSTISAILSMSVVTAYASFILAEHVLHVSGVIATVSAALMLSIYGMSRIPVNVKPIVSETWEFVGLVANSFLFLLVGLSINTSSLISHLDSILVVIVIVLLARAATVYSLVPLTVKFFHLPKLSIADRHIMWWGGLKGGLAIAMVLSIPESLPGRELLINLTLGVVVFTLIVNAWSIRPLMHLLKMDRLTEDEQFEFERELHHAGKQSAKLLRQYRELGVLSNQLGEKLNLKINESFKNLSSNIITKSSRRQVFLFSLKAEFDALEQLYSTGIIDQYTFLDIKNILQTDREKFQQNETFLEDDMLLDQGTLFRRLELWILQFTREKNWAIPFLSHFQSLRLKQGIQRRIADIVMSSIAIERLQNETSFSEENKQAMVEFYHNRMQHRKNSLYRLREDYQEIFASIEKEIFTKAALISARIGAEQEFHHGEIGIKAFNKITQIISTILQDIYLEKEEIPQDIVSTLGALPLFEGLSDSALKALAEKIQTVTFLSGDTIIGEGERGDALYILKSGVVDISKADGEKQTPINTLEQGDFFGEMALLGDQIRSATVTARTTVVSLRLKRSDVLAIAGQNNEIDEQLRQASDTRKT
ncbi:MAG: cyclic nucleotide-binding domain-containing protein [Gammaproteobacteria bacterium]|nr:cyclic nucleotide-binding domain-containing protein [Gammaproteobacteria bacterium]